MTWNRLTPQQVAERLGEKAGLHVDQAKALLRAQAELAYTEAAHGFVLPGLGTFSQRDTPERRGRNPHTGETIVIKAKKITRFRVSRRAKEMVANPSQPMPDIFKAPEIPEFAFSVHATELAQDAPILKDLSGPHRTNKGAPIEVRFHQLPDMRIPSGRICAADPMLITGAAVFARQVPPGKYPLILAVGADRRIALAILRFSPNHVVRWEITPPYGVDSALGCFCDEAVVQQIAEVEDMDSEFFERLHAEMFESRPSAPGWVHADSPAGTLAAFPSGDGDGTYSSYFGLDEDGEPALLVTDFGVVRFPPGQ